MTINILGSEIRKLRKQSGQSLEEVAGAVGVERSHLNKIELGRYKPSEELLKRLFDHFSVKGYNAGRLLDLRAIEPVVHTEASSWGKENTMVPMAKPQPPKVAQVSINPANSPVLYTDSVFVTSSEYGLVLDVAQKFPGGPQQHVVARIGMSFDHAKKLIEVINDHLQKNER